MESQGARLKKIRQELGLSLEEAHKKTKIHINILKALEGDSLSNLSPIYLKGFLKIYCKFLGVDPKDYITDYKETQSQATKAKAALAAPSKVSFIRLSKKFKRVSVYILISILLVFGLFKLAKLGRLKHKKHIIQKKISSPLPDKIETKKIEKLQTAQVIKSQKDAPSGIRLVIRARENCWLNLKADGRVVFQSVLEKGRSENWQAKDRIELSLGNAGAVELDVNGQQFLKLGKRGQALKNILITKEGLKIAR